METAEVAKTAGDNASVDYTSSVEVVDEIVRRITVVVPEGRFNRDYQATLKREAKQVQMDGFRRGKVPLEMVDRLFGPRIKFDIINSLFQSLLEPVFNEHKIVPQTAPEAESSDFEANGDLKFVIKVEVSPEVKLESYFGNSVEVERREVTDSDIDKDIEVLVEESREVVPVSGRDVLEVGDIAALEIATKVEDGELSAVESVTHKIGSGSLSSQLEGQLVGLEVDGERVVLFIADDTHPVAGLRGKEVSYRVKLRSISAPKEVILDDDWAKGVTSLPQRFQSMSELRAFIREKKVAENNETAKNDSFRRVCEVILERNPFRVPRGQIEDETRRILRGFGLQISDEDWYSPRSGQYREWFGAAAEKNVKFFYLINAIVQQEGVIVPDEEVDKELSELAESHGKAVKDLGSQKHIDHLRIQIKHRKVSEQVVDLLIAKNTITYVAPKDVAPKDDKEDIADEAQEG